MGSKVVRLKELEGKLHETIKEKNRNFIVVGHIVPDINIGQDITVVIRLNLKELIKRLEARGYQKEKIKENIVSETVNYCGVNSRERCRETYEVETDLEKEEVIGYIASRISGKRTLPPKTDEISKLDELLEIITSGNKYNL